MRWSWKITRIAGIDVFVHATFFLLVLWVATLYWRQFGTLAAVFDGVVFILALFICVVLHELGHSLTARRYGIKTRHITLLPIGGVAALERMPDDPRQEIHVALAGPMVNVGIALLLWLWIRLNGVELTPEAIEKGELPLIFRLLIVNIMLAVFNMVPAFPMDGGRVLRAALALRMPHLEATRKAAGLGQSLALVFGLLGLFYNPVLLLIALFIWIGASAETGAEELKTALHDVTVRQAMLTEHHILSPDQPLQAAIDFTLAGSQTDFPVGTRHRLEGVLTQRMLLEALQSRESTTSIGQVQLAPLPMIAADHPLEEVMQRLQQEGVSMIAVEENGQAVGFINLDNILELVKIHEALSQRRADKQRGY